MKAKPEKESTNKERLEGKGKTPKNQDAFGAFTKLKFISQVRLQGVGKEVQVDPKMFCLGGSSQNFKYSNKKLGSWVC